MKERETFGSRIGFLLVSAGCAIGIGNVWKFPYICGQYGGAAFIVIYLVFLAVLGLPILVCEFAVGRSSRKGMASAFEILQPAGTKWHRLKWISILGCYLLMMFYTMVAGWMLYYAYRTAAGKLSGLNPEQVAGAFGEMLGSAPTMILWMVIAVAVSFLVCALGLQNGVEKITKWMMSILIVLMVVLAVHSLFLPGASEGVRFYLIPDFSLVAEKGIGTAVYAAMSQAFFTLSVGIGAMAIFGSYMILFFWIHWWRLWPGLSFCPPVLPTVWSREQAPPCCLSPFRMYSIIWPTDGSGVPVSLFLCPLPHSLR